MSRKTLALLGMLTALNILAVAFNFAPSSRAAVAGMNAKQLMHDHDFVRAVKSVVQSCHVNVDLAKISC